MRIRKFEGTTEKEVIEMVKDELGLDALVLNIKKIQPKGIFSIFRKPTVEVTAAYEEKPVPQKSHSQFQVNSLAEKSDYNEMRDNIDVFDKMLKEKKINEQDEKIKELEKRLVSTEEMLEKAVSHLSISMHKLEGERKYQNNLIQIFYEALIDQGVLPEIAEKILEELDLIGEKDEININMIVKIVYNRIVGILGEPDSLDISKKSKSDAKVAAFIGSTGVGKTTTIAKLSADFILNRKLEVGLITADTYRIAAVEQLKTYADILGVEIEVVYNPNDLAEYVEIMRSLNDVILIDTAGRSHKNAENLKDLEELLAVVPACEIFLVMSLTTKYEDLLSIIKTYSAIADFKIIFTKLDETLYYGSILNVCYETGKHVSYVTMGQNVPDDIETVKPEKIAKALLGLGND